MTRQPAADRQAGRIHVVGAGLAGLAAAVELAGGGYQVTLYEASPHAGGRCRSFFDAELGVRIDNGNHLLLSGNSAALHYIERIGALGTFEASAEAALPFVDIASGEHWALRPSTGAIPWWLFSARRRVAGTGARDYLAALRLRRATAGDTVTSLLSRDTVLFRRLWEPLAIAALNTSPAEASAVLFARVLAETVARGAAACRPLVARDGLSESLVDPALDYLSRHGGSIRFGARLRGITFSGDRLAELTFDDTAVALEHGDEVVLAVPAPVAARLVPELTVPDDYAPIVNAHYRFDASPDIPLFLGIIGGTAEWVFRKRDVLSVTVSAADRIVGMSAEDLSELLWHDVAAALGLPKAPVPPSRIVKERRATFRATPAQQQRRPAAATRWNNLHLAGDYVDTGLPATIEGAIRSGIAAASLVRQLRNAAPTPRPTATRSTRPLPTTNEDYQRTLP